MIEESVILQASIFACNIIITHNKIIIHKKGEKNENYFRET